MALACSPCRAGYNSYKLLNDVRLRLGQTCAYIIVFIESLSLSTLLFVERDLNKQGNKYKRAFDAYTSEFNPGSSNRIFCLHSEVLAKVELALSLLIPAIANHRKHVHFASAAHPDSPSRLLTVLPYLPLPTFVFLSIFLLQFLMIDFAVSFHKEGRNEKQMSHFIHLLQVSIFILQ